MMKATRVLPWMTFQNKWKKSNNLLHLNFCKPISQRYLWPWIVMFKNEREVA